MKKLEGRFAYLPDGQKVRIESVFSGFPTCRRLGGKRKGTIAVCAVVVFSWTASQVVLQSGNHEAHDRKNFADFT